MTDDEVKAFSPISEPIYISSVIDRGKTVGHSAQLENEWRQTHSKKMHISSAPDLTLENYPYKDSIFCKYCGSRLRRIISNAGKVIWMCDPLDRKGKAFCKGIRVPDEKLRPLSQLTGPFFIGKEMVNGIETFGYSRKADAPAPSPTPPVLTTPAKTQ